MRSRLKTLLISPGCGLLHAFCSSRGRKRSAYGGADLSHLPTRSCSPYPNSTWVNICITEARTTDKFTTTGTGVPKLRDWAAKFKYNEQFISQIQHPSTELGRYLNFLVDTNKLSAVQPHTSISPPSSLHLSEQ